LRRYIRKTYTGTEGTDVCKPAKVLDSVMVRLEDERNEMFYTI
jgi:hypothetical protein